MLQVEELTAGYDGPPVVRRVSMHVAPGEMVALLGANGAGKSTTLLTISGLIKPRAGTVFFDGRDATARPPHLLAASGLVQVPEGRALVRSLTVAQNFRLVRRAVADPYELFPELAPLRSRKAGLLSGGEQQMLALARALIMQPKVLLVDELSLGLAPVIVQRLLSRLRALATDTGLAVLLVEQHVSAALAVADRAYVMARGRISLEGAGQDLLADRQAVASSYLGESASTVAANGG